MSFAPPTTPAVTPSWSLPFRFTIGYDTDVNFGHFLYRFKDYAFKFKKDGKIIANGLIVTVDYDDYEADEYVLVRTFNEVSQDYNGPEVRVYLQEFDEAEYQ